MQSYESDSDLDSIRLVASDMDFTLLADDKSMPPNMPERIHALSRSGILFSAASGRPTYTLRNLFGETAHDMALIADNGAAITVRDELIFKSLIPVDVYRELLRITCELGGIPIICGLDGAYIRSRDERYDSVFREFYHTIFYLESLDEVDVEANKFTVFFPERDSERAFADTFEPLFGEEFSVTCGGVEWIDIMNKGVDKGSAILRLCEHLGISVADAAAFGDTMNDIQMLERAGHSYLMANAAEHMRAHAKYLAPSNNDRGVAVVIDRILAARAAR